MWKIFQNVNIESRSSRRVAIFFSIVATGCLLNFLAIPFVDDSALILGFVASALATLVLGYRYGLVASVIVPLISVSSPIIILTIIIGVCESSVITICKKLRLSTVAVTSFYWVIIVYGITFFSSFFFVQEPELASTQQSIRFSISGLFSITTAYVVARVLWAKRYTALHQYPPMRYSVVITSTVLSVVIFVISVAAYVWLVEIDKQERRNFHMRATQASSTISSTIERTILHHGDVVRQLAYSSIYYPVSSVQFNAILDDALLAHSGFITMLRTNQDGDIVNAGPDFARIPLTLNQTLNVSDRDYFGVPSLTGTDYVSDVFQGRGFGNDLIVAISSPVRYEEKFQGVLQGSLSLTTINELIDSTLPIYHHYILVDQSERVIFASKEVDALFGQSISGTSLNAFLSQTNESNSFFRSDSNRLYMVNDTDLTDLGWKLIVGIEPVELENNLSEFIRKLHIFILSALLAAIIASGFLSKKITSPINQLVKKLETEKSFFDDASHRNEFFTNIQEVQTLYASAMSLRQQLHQKFTELELSANINSNLSSQLFEANEQLELRVKERTEQLRKSLIDAKKATLAKELFASSISHEIKNPLNGILGTTDYLLQLDIEQSLLDKISIIDKAGKDLLAFLEQVLSISSARSFATNLMCSVNNKEVIDNIFNLLSQDASMASIKLKSEIEKIELTTNKVVLKHILINLISNSIKHSGGSEITVESYLNDDQNLLFIVTDDGAGLDSKIKKTIFTPLQFSNFNNRGGAGLGLYIAKEMAQGIGGELRYDHHFKRGARFVLSIPFLCPLTQDNSRTEDTKTHSILPNRRLSAFVLDDIETNLKVVKSLLELAQVDAEVFTNHETLITSLNNKSPDIILIDYHLEGINGVEVAKYICDHELASREQIFILTASTHEQVHAGGASIYFSGIINKPISSKSIRELISSLK